MPHQPSDPEVVFETFVRNANAVGALSRTARTTGRPGADPTPPPAPLRKAAAAAPVRGPGEDTQLRQAEALVPEVRRISAPPEPIPEGSIDGQVPAGELDRTLTDMAVLVRYGHHDEARSKLEALVDRYPRDLLLLRRVAEFYVEHRRAAEAKEAFFRLAAGLFQQGNQVGMRKALDQVLVLDPGNERARRLIDLLERRALRSGMHGLP